MSGETQSTLVWLFQEFLLVRYGLWHKSPSFVGYKFSKCYVHVDNYIPFLMWLFFYNLIGTHYTYLQDKEVQPFSPDPFSHVQEGSGHETSRVHSDFHDRAQFYCLWGTLYRVIVAKSQTAMLMTFTGHVLTRGDWACALNLLLTSRLYFSLNLGQHYCAVYLSNIISLRHYAYLYQVVIIVEYKFLTNSI